MRAVLVEGTPEEISAFVRSSGMAVSSGPEASASASTPLEEFIAAKARGNPEKQRLVGAFADGISQTLPLRVQVGVKENGGQAEYFTARLKTIDEDRIGNVAYCRPSSGSVWLRVPAEAAHGFAYAERVASRKPPEKFAEVKHQVILKLVNDDAIAEAVKLTEAAVEMAGSGGW